MADGKPKALPAKPRQLSAQKRFAFRLIALCLPLVLLAVAELILRLCGFGGYAPIFRKVGPVQGGNLVITDQAGAISWFFANPDRPGYNDQYSFLDPKPTNTFRIFLVGESAMKGYPQPRNLASSAFLQAMLQDAWPDRRIEVINMGTTAVASFPVLGIMTEALEYQPDLIIIHTGHNEFFGTYGVASIGRAGGKPWMLSANRFLHSLALVQSFEKILRPKKSTANVTLMETMVGQNYIGPDDWRRAAAANNLHHNIAAMLERCQKRNVPVLVCTLPSNERDLAPIGQDMPTGDSSTTNKASDHFLAAKTLLIEGKRAEAVAEFDRARDLDTMPWRATSAAQEAILRAAHEHDAPVCDLVKNFRDNSPGGAIGWELMDDHVHPTLRGQALMAASFVSALTNLQGAARLTAEARQRIAPWEDYARRLGENPYDRYGVAHGMWVLFDVPFMRQSNPLANERFKNVVTEFENRVDPEVREVLREWQTVRPHAGGKRPITGMVARVMMRQKKIKEALELYEIAQHSVPQYTSWYLEYVYFTLACKEKLNGKLTDEERALALEGIKQGEVLLRNGFSETGFTERYIGRLHQLRAEFSEAIPFLQLSRKKLSGTDLVAADQALVISYVKTRQFDKARELVNYGVANAGQYSGMYQAMLNELPAWEQSMKTSITLTNAPR